MARRTQATGRGTGGRHRGQAGYEESRPRGYQGEDTIYGMTERKPGREFGGPWGEASRESGGGRGRQEGTGRAPGWGEGRGRDAGPVRDEFGRDRLGSYGAEYEQYREQASRGGERAGGRFSGGGFEPRGQQARPPAGPHAGRGPKGWKRSDERIMDEVCERLEEHPDLDASGIEVSVSEGEVTLAGTVDDRSAKRLAEDLAEAVPGVRDVHNRMRVGSGDAPAPESPAAAPARKRRP